MTGPTERVSFGQQSESPVRRPANNPASKGHGPQTLQERPSGPLRNAVLTAAVIAAALSGALAYVVHDHIADTKTEAARMTSIADQLEADPGWSEPSNNTGHLGYICRPFTGCAELQRRWASVPGLDAEDLQQRIDAAGWEMTINGDCLREPDTSGQATLCHASGFIQGYEVRISVLSKSSYEPESMLILGVF